MALTDQVPKAKAPDKEPVRVPPPTARQLAIIRMTREGMNRTAIAEYFNVSAAYVSNTVTILKKRKQWPFKDDGTPKKVEKFERVAGIMGVKVQGGPSKVQLRNVNSVGKMIDSLQRVFSVEGDLVCLHRDSTGAYSKLAPLVVKDMDSWDVLNAPDLPPGVGNGTRVVVWE